MLTIRDATRWDVRLAAGVLASAMVPTRLGRWLEPHPSARGKLLFDLFEARITAALRNGMTRLVEDGERIVAAALWLPCSDGGVRTVVPAGGATDFPARLHQLGRMGDQPHPGYPHLQLAGLGVVLRWQRHGIATRLLTEQQMSPAGRCLIADEALAVLAGRCGYRPRGAAVRLTDDTFVQPMLFSADTGVVRCRNTAPGRYRADAARSTPAGPVAPPSRSGENRP